MDKKLNKKNIQKKSEKKEKKLLFVVQKHVAKTLHYDFRLQIGKTLKSWAIPKGPSLSTKDKRLAILTENHPLSYAQFEGEIPKGQYGAGKVLLWDKGNYKNIKKDKEGKILSMKSCFEKGQIEVELKGKKLKGPYALIHFKEKNWLLIKMKEKK